MTNLVAIYQNTIELCKKADFPVYRPIKYNYHSYVFKDENILSKKKPYDHSPIIWVENTDSFDMAMRMEPISTPIMVLNLASYTHSGGGVDRGARAQEEDLYRQSNYFQANDQRLYPLNMDEVIYSPLVHIIKNNRYQVLEKPFPVSCLAVAAIRNPEIKYDSDWRAMFSNRHQHQITQEKIDMIFKVAILHGHDSLVLGALGCGAYLNPPHEIAQMFKRSLSKYSSYFKRIGFAVLSHEGNPNYDIFRKAIMG